MSSAISEGLLIHTASLYPATTSIDDYGKPVPADEIKLTKIRVVRAKRTVAEALGEAKNDRLTLIYDCTFSLPRGVVFNHGDKVVRNGKTYTVREATDPSGDEEGPHHWKVALV
jgi:hypothetical protein